MQDIEFVEEMRENLKQITNGLDLGYEKEQALGRLIMNENVDEWDIEAIIKAVDLAKETPIPPRSFGPYEVVSSLHIGRKEVCFCEAEKPPEEAPNCRYGVFVCTFDNPFGVAWPEKQTGYTDFIEANKAYLREADTLVMIVEQARKVRGPNPPIGEDHCIPGSAKMDYDGQVVVKSAEHLRPEFRHSDYQIFLASGGFGCSPDSRGRAVFATNLYDGEECRLERHNILGIIKPECMLDWAKDGLSKIEKRKEANIKAVIKSNGGAKGKPKKEPDGR